VSSFDPRLTGADYVICCYGQHCVEYGVQIGELGQHER